MDTLLDTGPVSQDDVLLAYIDDGQYPAPHARASAPSAIEIERSADPRDDEIGLAPTGELEPAIVAAIKDAILELVQATDAVRNSSLKLRRAGDPLGLMDGDGIAEATIDTNAPTPERVASRGEFELVNVSVGAGRDAKADVWRHVPVVEAMVRRGQIGKEYAAAYTEAARRFYRDFINGHRGPSVTSRYGELASGGGTPISQQTQRYYFDKFGREFEVPGPEDRRYDANKAWWRACQAIGVVKCQVTGKPYPSETLHWMMVLVCEDYSVASEKTPSLEDAGRAYLGYKSPVQASAAGAALIKCGLERLVTHYGIDL
jgi:hypothetical protein